MTAIQSFNNRWTDSPCNSLLKDLPMRRSVLAILVLIASCAPDPVRLEDRPALPAAALTCS